MSIGEGGRRDQLGAPVEDYLAHAQFHARESPTGIGVAVVRTGFEDGKYIWYAVVTDGSEWHYIRVESREIGAFPSVSTEDVEHAIERFSATLPSQYRLRALLNANPLHLGPGREITD